MYREFKKDLHIEEISVLENLRIFDVAPFGEAKTQLDISLLFYALI